MPPKKPPSTKVCGTPRKYMFEGDEVGFEEDSFKIRQLKRGLQLPEGQRATR